MNPLTQIKNTQKISREEIAAGYSDSQSWHARFKHSAYIFAGGLPYKLTDGDLLAIFSQYGEIIDVNLVRHKDTGKPRGFAFLAYEDQRSTNLAVDNLNGMKVGGRMITVDHVDNYKRKRAEAEGREESDSEEEIEEAEAEAAALQAAAGEGAQVVTAEEATVQERGHDGDEPWAAKTSVHALLNAELPARKPDPHDEEEEDPLALMQRQKKHKKEKKSKKKKDKEKGERKQVGATNGAALSEENTLDRGIGKMPSHGDKEVRPTSYKRPRGRSRSPDRQFQREKHSGRDESRLGTHRPHGHRDQRGRVYRDTRDRRDDRGRH